MQGRSTSSDVYGFFMGLQHLPRDEQVNRMRVFGVQDHEDTIKRFYDEIKSDDKSSNAITCARLYLRLLCEAGRFGCLLEFSPVVQSWLPDLFMTITMRHRGKEDMLLFMSHEGVRDRIKNLILTEREALFSIEVAIDIFHPELNLENSIFRQLYNINIEKFAEYFFELLVIHALVTKNFLNGVYNFDIAQNNRLVQAFLFYVSKTQRQVIIPVVRGVIKLENSYAMKILSFTHARALLESCDTRYIENIPNSAWRDWSVDKLVLLQDLYCKLVDSDFLNTWSDWVFYSRSPLYSCAKQIVNCIKSCDQEGNLDAEVVDNLWNTIRDILTATLNASPASSESNLLGRIRGYFMNFSQKAHDIALANHSFVLK